MEKLEEWQAMRPQQVMDIIVQSVLGYTDAPKMGEIMKGDDGKHYILTINGYKECNVTI